MNVATPVTPGGLQKFDKLPPPVAAASAWMDGGRNPAFHEIRRQEMRLTMPLLARALDRLAEAVDYR